MTIDAGLHTVAIDAALSGAAERLSALRPDVVVVDLGTAQSEPVMALWEARPEVVLIGVDRGADRMLIPSGQPARALTAEDLIETLSTRTKGSMQ